MASTPQPRSASLLILAALLAAGTLGCSSGRPAAAVAPEPDNIFSIDAFQYSDPYAADFQPLRTTEFRASRREELAMFAANSSATSVFAYDDGGAGHAQLGAFTASLLEHDFRVLASASGPLDDVAGDDIVVLGRRGAEQTLIAHVLTYSVGGEWKRPFTLSIPTAGFDDAGVTLVDLDGDGRDELVVTVNHPSTGGFLRVYDDPMDGFRVLRNVDATRVLGAAAFDPAHSGKPGIAMLVPGAVQVYTGAAQQFTLLHDLRLDPPADRLVVGNFDERSGDEFAMIRNEGGDLRRISTYRLVDGAAEQIETMLLDTERLVRIFDVIAVDTNGDGVDEVALAAQRSDHAALCHWVPASDRGPWPDRYTLRFLTGAPVDVALQAHDSDADGREEIAIASFKQYVAPEPNPLELFSFRAELAGEYLALTQRQLSFGGSLLGGSTLSLCAGDFDRENFTLRSTGKKWLHLASPLPIALLAAPPTQGGIDQNREASSTSYGTESAREVTHGSAVSHSFSVALGYELEDPSGFFGLSAKLTVSREMEWALSHSKQVTWTKTFAGPHDADLIVFQGTLFQCYEYEVSSAANARMVGTKILLNDPVATRIYKWTVDDYNKLVPANQQIGLDVVTHRVGHVASYLRQGEARGVLDSTRGWIDEGLVVGAVPGGSNSTSVTLTEANSDSESRRWEVGLEGEIKLGGVTVGGSHSLSGTHIYEVTTEVGTTYQGTVGDIASGWGDHQYRFGLLVYRYGEDREGHRLPGKTPFQVVTYWVDHLGPGFSPGR